MANLRVSEAAQLLGVSDDTVRRWGDLGRLNLGRDQNGHWFISGKELAEFMVANRPAQGAQIDGGERGHMLSARNTFPGIVTRVVKDTVMAQVEIQAGPHRVVSLLSREAVDEMGLEPGVRASASVKATNVVIEATVDPSAS